MTFQDLFKSNPKVWLPMSELLDNVLTDGINDRFDRAEREYIFAYFSKSNECNFCYTHHIDFAYDLGYKDTIDIETLTDDAAIENIFWIKNVALFVNNVIKEYNITQVSPSNKMLKDTSIKNYGYNYYKSIGKT